MRQRAVPGPDVVDREPPPVIVELVHDVEGHRLVVEHGALRQLEDDVGGCETVIGSRRPQPSRCAPVSIPPRVPSIIVPAVVEVAALTYLALPQHDGERSALGRAR